MLKSLLALTLAFTPTGDIPVWAQHVQVVQSANNGQQHWLAEVLGCVANERLDPRQTVQCRETFLYLAENAQVGRSLSLISNVQVAGYAHEVMSVDSRVGTVGNGRIDRAVRFDGLCYGNVGQCIGLRAESIEFTNGFHLQVNGDRLELTGPDGGVRQEW